VFRVECVDWTGGQIKNDESSDDVKNVDLSQVHYLSGPITVEGAEPGDLLKVEFLDLGTLDDDEWGFTGSFAKENGGGFLTEHFPKATKACWDIEGIYCSSRHIPGVRFVGLIHPGLIGTAPSAELLNMWNERESALVAEEGTEKEKTLCGWYVVMEVSKSTIFLACCSLSFPPPSHWMIRFATASSHVHWPAFQKPRGPCWES
jgi:formamidase